MMRTLPCQPLYEIGRRPLLTFRFLRILEQPRLTRADFRWKRRVDNNWHREIQSGSPKAIIFLRRK
jgi:hypothetical protein